MYCGYDSTEDVFKGYKGPLSEVAIKTKETAEKLYRQKNGIEEEQPFDYADRLVIASMVASKPLSLDDRSDEFVHYVADLTFGYVFESGKLDWNECIPPKRILKIKNNVYKGLFSIARNASREIRQEMDKGPDAKQKELKYDKEKSKFRQEDMN